MPEFDSTTEYRDIPGFPGYKAGSDGSIWSCRTTAGKCGQRWKQLRARVVTQRRLQVQLWPGAHQFYVHRLVLLAFRGPCPDGMETCHFPDPDPANCSLRNLRWDTPEANMLDSYIQGTERRGERCPQAKLTDNLVRSIRADYAARRATLTQLARRHGVCVATIDEVVRRKTWTHVE